MVAVQITMLDQNEKEVDSLNIFKEQHRFLHKVESYATNNIP